MSQSNQLRNVNLNLLPILYTLLKHRNVTIAAKELHLTQSTVSGSLKRLREVFDNELLVFNGRELLLTEKAKAMLPQLERFQLAGEALLGTLEFDPGEITNRFRIASADWLSFLLVPPLHERLNGNAPKAGVQFVHGDRSSGEDMRQGMIDMVIAPEKVSDWSGLNLFNENSDYQYEYLFTDQMVCIESTRHAPSLAGLDQDAYLRHTHISFNLGSRVNASIERDTLAGAGLTQNDQFLLPEFTTLPHMVAATGCIAAIPLSLARPFQAVLPIRIFEPPVTFPPLKIIMAWTKASDRDASQCWFRQQVRESIRELAAGWAEAAGEYGNPASAGTG
ncbi:LysR family transcriptional regulator [Paraburkholderia sp.]|uniref:LysR family transcriptional regulator n=1 Tax=Paraburkholderia sp. TaxID=1926495 RepID=UPI0039E5A957